MKLLEFMLISGALKKSLHSNHQWDWESETLLMFKTPEFSFVTELSVDFHISFYKTGITDLLNSIWEYLTI